MSYTVPGQYIYNVNSNIKSINITGIGGGGGVGINNAVFQYVNGGSGGHVSSTFNFSPGENSFNLTITFLIPELRMSGQFSLNVNPKIKILAPLI